MSTRELDGYLKRQKPPETEADRHARKIRKQWFYTGLLLVMGGALGLIGAENLNGVILASALIAIGAIIAWCVGSVVARRLVTDVLRSSDS